MCFFKILGESMDTRRGICEDRTCFSAVWFNVINSSKIELLKITIEFVNDYMVLQLCKAQQRGPSLCVSNLVLTWWDLVSLGGHPQYLSWQHMGLLECLDVLPHHLSSHYAGLFTQRASKESILWFLTSFKEDEIPIDLLRWKVRVSARHTHNSQGQQWDTPSKKGPVGEPKAIIDLRWVWNSAICF